MKKTVPKSYATPQSAWISPHYIEEEGTNSAPKQVEVEATKTTTTEMLKDYFASPVAKPAYNPSFISAEMYANLRAAQIQHEKDLAGSSMPDPVEEYFDPPKEEKYAEMQFTAEVRGLKINKNTLIFYANSLNLGGIVTYLEHIGVSHAKSGYENLKVEETGDGVLAHLALMSARELNNIDPGLPRVIADMKQAILNLYNIHYVDYVSQKPALQLRKRSNETIEISGCLDECPCFRCETLENKNLLSCSRQREVEFAEDDKTNVVALFANCPLRQTNITIVLK